MEAALADAFHEEVRVDARANDILQTQIWGKTNSMIKVETTAWETIPKIIESWPLICFLKGLWTKSEP